MKKVLLMLLAIFALCSSQSHAVGNIAEDYRSLALVAITTPGVCYAIWKLIKAELIFGQQLSAPTNARRALVDSHSHKNTLQFVVSALTISTFLVIWSTYKFYTEIS